MSTDSGLTWSVAVRVPGWQAQPDVWLLVAGLAAGYWIAVVRVGPRYVDTGTSRRHAGSR